MFIDDFLYLSYFSQIQYTITCHLCVAESLDDIAKLKVNLVAIYRNM